MNNDDKNGCLYSFTKSDNMAAITVGSYTLSHPTIQYFWEVVAQFSEEDKKRLLKFVTSCSRPPLLGFKVHCSLGVL